MRREGSEAAVGEGTAGAGASAREDGKFNAAGATAQDTVAALEQEIEHLKTGTAAALPMPSSPWHQQPTFNINLCQP